MFKIICAAVFLGAQGAYIHSLPYVGAPDESCLLRANEAPLAALSADETITVRCPSTYCFSHSSYCYGTGVYSDDSRVCVAARHQFGLNQGGLFNVTIRASGYTASFSGSSTNSVLTGSKDFPQRSFTLAYVGPATCPAGQSGGEWYCTNQAWSNAAIFQGGQTTCADGTTGCMSPWGNAAICCKAGAGAQCGRSTSADETLPPACCDSNTRPAAGYSLGTNNCITPSPTSSPTRNPTSSPTKAPTLNGQTYSPTLVPTVSPTSDIGSWFCSSGVLTSNIYRGAGINGGQKICADGREACQIAPMNTFSKIMCAKSSDNLGEQTADTRSTTNDKLSDNCCNATAKFLLTCPTPPTSSPTKYPTPSPTNYPTSRPTTSYPTTLPTTSYPTKKPTVAQTKTQTVKTTSPAPTNAPTAYPTYKFGAQVQIVELQMTLNGLNKESFNEAAKDAFKISVALLLGVKKNNVIVIILSQTASAQRTRHRRMDAADSVTLDVQILTADTTAAAQALTVLGQSDFETSLATTMTSDSLKMQVPTYTTTSSITVDDIDPSKISTSQVAMTQAMVTATNTDSNPGTTSNDVGGSGGGVGAGVIAGAVIGALAGAALLSVGILMARNRKAGTALGLQRGPSAVNVQSAATGSTVGVGASVARKLSDSSITTAHTNPMKADEL